MEEGLLPGIRYSVQVMEEPFYSFEFQTGLDLGTVVNNSELFDSGPSLLGSFQRTPGPCEGKPSEGMPPGRRSLFSSSRQPPTHPPSHLKRALQSLLRPTSKTNPNKKKFSKTLKYTQHDLPSTILNKRIIQRFPLNMYEKFRHKPVEPPVSQPADVKLKAASKGPKEQASPELEITQLPVPGRFLNYEGLNNVDDLDQFYNENKNKFNCPFCKGVFKYKGTLKRHLLVKHTFGDGVLNFSSKGKDKKSAHIIP